MLGSVKSSFVDNLDLEIDRLSIESNSDVITHRKYDNYSSKLEKRQVQKRYTHPNNNSFYHNSNDTVNIKPHIDDDFDTRYHKDELRKQNNESNYNNRRFRDSISSHSSSYSLSSGSLYDRLVSNNNNNNNNNSESMQKFKQVEKDLDLRYVNLPSMPSIPNTDFSKNTNLDHISAEKYNFLPSNVEKNSTNALNTSIGYMVQEDTAIKEHTFHSHLWRSTPNHNEHRINDDKISHNSSKNIRTTSRDDKIRDEHRKIGYNKDREKLPKNTFTNSEQKVNLELETNILPNKPKSRISLDAQSAKSGMGPFSAFHKSESKKKPFSLDNEEKYTKSFSALKSINNTQYDSPLMKYSSMNARNKNDMKSKVDIKKSVVQTERNLLEENDDKGHIIKRLYDYEGGRNRLNYKSEPAENFKNKVIDMEKHKDAMYNTITPNFDFIANKVSINKNNVAEAAEDDITRFIQSRDVSERRYNEPGVFINENEFITSNHKRTKSNNNKTSNNKSLRSFNKSESFKTMDQFLVDNNNVSTISTNKNNTNNNIHSYSSSTNASIIRLKETENQRYKDEILNLQNKANNQNSQINDLLKLIEKNRLDNRKKLEEIELSHNAEIERTKNSYKEAMDRMSVKMKTEYKNAYVKTVRKIKDSFEKSQISKDAVISELRKDLDNSQTYCKSLEKKLNDTKFDLKEAKDREKRTRLRATEELRTMRTTYRESLNKVREDMAIWKRDCINKLNQEWSRRRAHEFN